jgi:hypothetical protein
LWVESIMGKYLLDEGLKMLIMIPKGFKRVVKGIFLLPLSGGNVYE